VTFENGHHMPDGSAKPDAKLGIATRLAFCAVVIAVAILADTATSAWGVREHALFATIGILAVIVSLLLRHHRLTDQRLAAERRQLIVAVNNIPQGLVLYDASARIVICNQPYIEMFGLSPDVAKPGCTMQRLIQHRKETGSFDGDVDEFCDAIIRNVSLGIGTRQLTEAPGGRAIEIVNRPLKAGGWVATIEDITERTRADEKIAHLAHYDALTDLPNRVLFRERLEQALRAVRPGEQLAVLYIDIDEFKGVNDALGHPVGDELLQGVAERLRGCLKETDVAARLGGDEFAVIQCAIKNQSETTQLVDRIYEAIRAPLECAGHLITTDASIGIALAPGDGLDLDQLLKNADLALYGAKGDGRRTYRFFEAGMDARAKARRILELELRQAITDGSLEVHNGVEDAMLEPSARELGEEPLDGVEPGRRCWREVEGPARVMRKPFEDLRMFVGGIVVENGVDRLAGGHLRLDGVEEADELLVAVPLHVLADHGAIEDIECGKQRRRAMALVVVGQRGAASLLHRQAGLRAVERLDLRLLIHG